MVDKTALMFMGILAVAIFLWLALMAYRVWHIYDARKTRSRSTTQDEFT